MLQGDLTREKPGTCTNRIGSRVSVHKSQIMSGHSPFLTRPRKLAVTISRALP